MGDRPINKSIFSMEMSEEIFTLPKSLRSETTVALKFKDGIYAIDKEDQMEETIMSQLGRSMEKWLTLDSDEYGKYLISSHLTGGTLESDENSFNYTAIEDILVRSQIDCHDTRLPKPFFDIKTRAISHVRWSLRNDSKFQKSIHKTLTKLSGPGLTFESELYDLARGMMLKYKYS
jgi:hypothetical protein